MKEKPIAVVLILTILVQILLNVIVSIKSLADEMVTIQCNDAVFYSKLVKQLGDKISSKDDAKLTITMTQENVDSVTKLEIKGNSEVNQMTDITGIENFTSLTWLLIGCPSNLSTPFKYSQISDISAISGLTNLKTLYLNNNQIRDISAISGLTNLTYLSLSGNQISDISAISGLTNLKTLYLNNNQIRDISAISGLTNLTSLDLGGNQISDISTMSGLTNLTSLDLGRNQISDISTMSGLTNLTSLYLNNNQISDISAISGLTNLTYLSLSGNQISDISTISGLTNLTDLSLYNNQIRDISAISGLTNLTYLSLSGHQISDISAISGLTNLKTLDLNNNQIRDISAISGLTNLKLLELDNNQISDISAISGLTNLKTLYLNNNQIRDISAISGLTNLTSLDLGGNQISDISTMSGLTNLTSLYLINNQISDISAISGLTNLTVLNLYNNQISGISNIREVELPQIIVAAKDINSKIYTTDDYILTNCTLSSDGTKIIIDDNAETASIEIYGGKASGTKYTVSVDMTPPELKVEKGVEILTNQNVTVTITSNEEIQEVEGWELSEGKMILTKIFSQNGNETVVVKDLAGNEATAQIEVNNIDKEAPTAEVSKTPNTKTAENVTVTITANEEVQEINGWTRTEDRKKLTKVYSENGSETVTLKDLAGNSSQVQIEVNNIDKEAPTVEVSKTPSTKTTGNVTVTITANEEVQEINGWTRSEDRKKLTKVYIENNSETVTIKDLAGNTSQVQIEVNNIDKEENTNNTTTNDNIEAPKELNVKVSYSTVYPTNKEVTVTITANEEIQEVEGWELSKDKKKLTKIYNDNGDETVVVKDLAGNETTAQIEVNNIEKEENTNNTTTNDNTEDPKELNVKVSYSTVDPVNKEVTVTITANEEIQEVEGWELSKDKKKLTKTYNDNGEEIIVVKDLEGRSTVVNIKVDNIDVEAPRVEEKTNEKRSDGKVKVTIKVNEDIIVPDGWILDKEKNEIYKIYDKNTEEIVEIKDKAGNIITVTVKVTEVEENATKENNQNKEATTSDNTIAKGILPQTGTGKVIITLIVVIAILGVIGYIKVYKYKEV